MPAALRLGIKTVLIPKGNEVDIAELPKEVRRGPTSTLANTSERFLSTFAASEEAPQVTERA